MLRRVTIENFRSCVSVELDHLGGIVALVGRNGAGKTNILQAISWASQLATSMEPMDPFELSRILLPTTNLRQPTSVRLVFSVDEIEYTYFISIKSAPILGADQLLRGIDLEAREQLEVQLQDQERQCILDRHGRNLTLQFDGTVETPKISSTTASLPAVQQIHPDHPATRYVHSASEFLRSIKYDSLDEPSSPDRMNPFESVPIEKSHYLSRTRDLHMSAKTNGFMVMQILELHEEKAPEFDELRNLLGSNGLGLIDEIRVQLLGMDASRMGQYYVVEFLQNVPEPEWFSYSQLSYGTRRVIRLLVSVLRDAHAVLLLEQPEDAIHAGLVCKLVALLRAYVDPRQIFIASHSPALLDGLEAKEIRLVNMENGKTHARPLTAKQIQNASDYIAHEGTLSEYLELVEGN